MKCQNCGNNDASFHYTSNVNGDITEKHLCNGCAGKMGYMENTFFDTDSMFSDMFDGFFRRPQISPFSGFGLAGPMLRPHVDVSVKRDEAPVGVLPAQPQTAEIDEEFKARREMNMLREQMRQAAQAEDFEKAAEIRDQIKRLEN